MIQESIKTSVIIDILKKMEVIKNNEKLKYQLDNAIPLSIEVLYQHNVYSSNKKTVPGCIKLFGVIKKKDREYVLISFNLEELETIYSIDDNDPTKTASLPIIKIISDEWFLDGLNVVKKIKS